MRLPAYAELFAASGIATLCFDYRSWGESDGTPRFVASIREQQRDVHAAIDFIKTLPGIDGSRIALWGTSFGGGHAISVAARRDDLAAVVAQCAVVDCLAVSLGTPLPQVARWLWAAGGDVVHMLLGMKPLYVPLASKPGTNGLMTSLDAEDQYRAMLTGRSRWENKIAARLFLTLPFYRPIASARRVAAPLMMVVTDNDELCSGELQARVAALAPAGTARHYAATHFEIYFGELFERAASEMTAFLSQHLGVSGSSQHAATRPA